MKKNIAAIATPIGVGGISIIRISGENSIEVMNKYFKNEIINNEKNTISYNKFINDKKEIDEVLVSIFRSPYSFTGENIVEINCHGGIYVTNLILEIILQDEEIRLANPGEFSKISFLNGKKNLIEIESIMDLINAKTSDEYNISRQTKNIVKEIETIWNTLIDILALLEVNIDYPEYEDIEQVNIKKIEKYQKEIMVEIKKIIENSEKGIILKEGIKTAIVGKPNVGKSSLLNYFSKDEKAIVSEIEGTTRDIIEQEVNLGKVKLNLIDTAGIRETKEVIEKIGIEKSKDAILDASLILYMVDASKKMDDEELKLYKLIKNKKHLVIINKIDLKEQKEFEMFEKIIYISIKEQTGLENIEKEILKLFDIHNFDVSKEVYSANIKIISLLKIILTKLENLQINNDLNLLEIDIKDILEDFGEILNKNVKEDVLDTMFSNFCLGK